MDQRSSLSLVDNKNSARKSNSSRFDFNFEKNCQPCNFQKIFFVLVNVEQNKLEYFPG